MDYSKAISHLIPFILEKYENFELDAENATNHFLEQNPSEKIACTKGCGACCYFPLVPITAGEAFVLLNRLLAEGIDLNQLAEKLFLYAEKYFENAYENNALPFKDSDQKKFLTKKLPCPFFVKEEKNEFSGHCGIFGLRPLICGFYNSIDSPKLCTQKLSHRSIEQTVGLGSLTQDSIRDFERKTFGRSTLGHLPLLLAALCTKEGLEAFLNEVPLSDEELKEEFAEGVHDFSLYTEMLKSIGYEIGENDLLALEEAQSEMIKNCLPT
jgi:Fe-S-cluster containining protein